MEQMNANNTKDIPAKFSQGWLDEVFTYHAASPEQQAAYVAIRSQAKVLCRSIIDNVPDCADKTAAIRLVREAVMTANAAIALNGLI